MHRPGSDINERNAIKSVLVTGAGGFIGRNLLEELKRHELLSIKKQLSNESDSQLEERALKADLIYHLAAVTRSDDPDAFQRTNVGMTARLCEILASKSQPVTIVYSSSTLAGEETPYGRSKLMAEKLLQQFAESTEHRVCIYRLPNVFGKWSRPNHNSAVATICHSLVKNHSLDVSMPENSIVLVYIDDVVKSFQRHLQTDYNDRGFYQTEKRFQTNVGKVVEILTECHHNGGTESGMSKDESLEEYLGRTYRSFKLPCS